MIAEMSTRRPGYQLPLLLAAGFRSLIDELHTELAERGFDGVRPLHGFALQAIGAHGATTSQLGRRLGISKQAAAKTAGKLEESGLIRRDADEDDRRARRLTLTPRGRQLLAASAEVFESLRSAWVERLGADRVTALEDDLEAAVRGTGDVALGDLPGWLR